MSLIAHWPLNGDTNDISGNDNHATNHSAVVDNAGKIGKCYSFRTSGAYAFTGASKYISTGLSNDVKKSYTLMVWASEATSGQLVGFNPPVYNGLSLYINGTTAYASVNNSTQVSVSSSGLVNQWNHLVAIFDIERGEIRIYVNGELKNTNTSWNGVSVSAAFNIGTDDTSNPEWNYQGKLNDVRIYDHVVSDKEIKLISQAKVLHYTFNDMQEPTTNYYGDMSTVSNLRSPRTDWTGDLPNELIGTNTKAYKFTSGALNSTWSGNSYGYMGMSTTCASDGEYATFSSWLYVSNDCDITLSRVVIEGESSNDSDANYPGNYDMSRKGTWQKVSRKAISDGNMTGYFYPYKNGVTDGSFSGYMVWAGAQWEKGEYATEFCDEHREGKVSDISGYSWDAVLEESTTPRWTEDSGIGTGAYYFVSGTKISMTLPNSFSGFTDCTISFWRKNDSSITYWLPFVGQNNGYYLMATSSGTGHFYHNNSGSNLKIYKDGVYSGTSSVTPFTDTTTWHHYVIKGVNLSSWTAFNLSGYGGSWDCEGYFSDIRLYNTSLSDEDILSLYEQKASIDNKGDLFINELKEYKNKAKLINDAINNKERINGLDPYSQSNCTSTLTNDGCRIYREPNLTISEDGYSMWGGFRASLEEEALIEGHDYILTFKIKGQTSNNMEIYFGYEVGWTTMGIGLSRKNLDESYNFTDFQSNNYVTISLPYTVSGRYEYGTWNADITSGSNIITYTDKHTSAPDVSVGDLLVNNSYFPDGTKITAVTSDVSFTVDNNATSSGTKVVLSTQKVWDNYRQLKIGFGYASTGTLGSDVYIKDFKVYDITDIQSIKVRPNEKSQYEVQNISNVGITNGLVGYWPLNGHMYDYSGNNNDGSSVGTPTISIGVNNKLSYLINSSDGEYINLNKADVIDPNTGSVSVFINATAWDSRRMAIFASQNGASWTDLNIVLFSNSDNSITFSVSNGTTSINDTVNTGDILNTDQWYHLVGTYDGSYVRLYLDGSEIDSYQTTVTPGNFTNTFTGIGWHYSSRGFNGKICQVKVFNRALTPEEIMIENQVFNSDKQFKKAKDGTLYISGDIKEGL